MRENYKKVLLQALLEGHWEEAQELIMAFHKLGEAADAQCLYLEASYYYYTKQYAMALFYAELGLRKDSGYEPLHELIYCLTEYEGDYKDYQPYFKADVSSYHRRLHIVMLRGRLKIVDSVADQFAKYFRALGHEVDFASAPGTGEDDSWKEELLQKCRTKVDLIVLFNNIGIIIETRNGDNYWDELHAPCINYLFDHPMYLMYYTDEAVNVPERMVVTCVDRNHVKFVKKYFKNIRHCFYLPLAGMEDVQTENVPWQERTVTALYVGSLKKTGGSGKDELGRKIYQFMVENPSYTGEDAIEYCYRRLVNEAADGEEIKQAIQKYRDCDVDTNAYYRAMLVKVLVEQGIYVDVYGGGWEDTDFYGNPYLRYHGCVSQEECVRQMKNAKFVLNSMPWFKDGIHDRIYNAMLAGAVSVTDTSRYLKETYQDGEDLLFYELEQMDRLPELIRKYEADPEEASRIAQKGYQHTALCHTWQNRAIELLERYFAGDYGSDG